MMNQTNSKDTKTYKEQIEEFEVAEGLDIDYKRGSRHMQFGAGHIAGQADVEIAKLKTKIEEIEEDAKKHPHRLDYETVVGSLKGKISTLEREKAELVGEVVEGLESRVMCSRYTTRSSVSDWWIANGMAGRIAADRLVALGAWQQHPTKPGLYRPVGGK